MADSLDDGEFWLPPKFLNDDDVFLEDECRGVGSVKNGKNGVVGLYPFEFSLGFGPFGFTSDMGSPVESLGSSETESDEEDYIAGLTRQMAHSTLEDGFSLDNSKSFGFSGSPQSTLCALGSGCGCKQGSSRGSPNAHSRAPHQQMTLDLLYAAAGEVSKMRINEETFNFHNSRPHLAPPGKTSPDAGVYQQLQTTQFLNLRRQQLIEQQNSAVRLAQTKATATARHPPQCPQIPQNRGRNGEFFNGGISRPTGLSSPFIWNQQKQSMNQQNSSGMRAVFLGHPNGKRECAGTGVFLPRQNGGTISETRKKPACSTVLVPARVMQALNLNLDGMCVQPHLHPRPPPALNTGKNDSSSLRLGNDSLSHNQKLNLRPPPVINHDIRLPQEWTY